MMTQQLFIHQQVHLFTSCIKPPTMRQIYCCICIYLFSPCKKPQLLPFAMAVMSFASHHTLYSSVAIRPTECYALVFVQSSIWKSVQHFDASLTATTISAKYYWTKIRACTIGITSGYQYWNFLGYFSTRAACMYDISWCFDYLSWCFDISWCF